MELTKAAIDKMLANIITVIGSSKFWISFLVVVAAGLGAWQFQDPIVKIILAMIGAITGGGYITAKTYQNTHGVNLASAPGAPSVALATAAPQVALAVATGVVPAAAGTARITAAIASAIPSTPEEVAAWQDKVETDIDNELAASFNLPTPESARKAHPELSSLNPSIIWSKTQIRLMDTVTGNILNNAEAIYATENLLLPAAKAALVDQQGQTMEQNITCSWPPSWMARDWVHWCNEHIEALKTVGDKFDFKGYTAWYAGEVAVSWVIRKIPWITTYVGGVQRNYIFPDKP